VGEKEGVDAVLGEPGSCENVSPSGVGRARKRVYLLGKAQVVFIGGRVDWITVSALGGAPFSADGLQAVGLSNVPPDVDNAVKKDGRTYVGSDR
jgi:hypothetical protein